jgi:hypothetical protein
VFVRPLSFEYIAGIIDGEGHFHTPRVKNGAGRTYIYPRVIVMNTNKELVDALKHTLGGNVYMYKAHDNAKACYRWSMTGKAVTALAHNILPYLIVKHEQVQRVL